MPHLILATRFHLAPVAILLLGLCPPLGGLQARDLSADTPGALQQAIEQAQPGDTIVMTAQEWSDLPLVFTGKGTSEAPITLKAAEPGKTILTGTSTLNISGEHLIIEGLSFKDPASSISDLVQFRRDSKTPARNCRLTNCAITDTQPASSDANSESRWLGLYGSGNRVDHCHFSGKTGKGATFVVWLGQPDDGHHRIDHNHFGPREKLGKNGGETIRIGDSKTSMLEAHCVVEHNLFEKCNGEVECISNKSCLNIYRYNTFLEVSGTLTLRHGNGCLVESNHFIGNQASGTGGIRIIGEDHIVRGNHFENLSGDEARAGICFMLGIPNSPANRYFQVKRALVESNVLINCKQSIFIGLSDDKDATLPPIDTVIRNNQLHSPNQTLMKAEGDISGITWINNACSGKRLGIDPAPPGLNAEPTESENLAPLDRSTFGPSWLASR